MRRLADLSYRIKIPLAITSVIVLTELVVTAALVTRAVADSRRDLQASASNLATVLARSLRDPMLRDDLWQAFEVIRTPLVVRDAANALHDIVVLDAQGHVFVSADPRRIPLMAVSNDLPPALRGLAQRHAGAARPAFHFVRESHGGEFGATAPVQAEDGSVLGAVLLTYDAERERRRVWAAIREIAVVSVPGMLLLIPLGWVWGKRIAEPLSRLTEGLARVGTQPANELVAMLPPVRGDEIGQLSRAARAMLEDMGRKEALEREMVMTERLAAVGRVSAAIAHEVNNPLGGMLNAIDTLETHGQPDPLTRKTMGLLQRGLRQVQATVGALLVEARLDSPELSSSDWHDLKTLVLPQLSDRGLDLSWRVETVLERSDAAPLPVPAHQVRQLLLNLLLNAISATSPGGTIALAARRSEFSLLLEVANTGAPIPSEKLSRLFEPFIAGDKADGRRHGLGLWVCYQIVQQLHGTIGVESDDGWTRVSVRLPLAFTPAQG